MVRDHRWPATSSKKGDNQHLKYFIKLYLPDQTGSWTIDRSSPLYRTYKARVSGELVPHDFHSESLTINVTSLTATRITGTFSGHFKLIDDPGNSKPMEITDGKFDMPMATSKVHPE